MSGWQPQQYDPAAHQQRLSGEPQREAWQPYQPPQGQQPYPQQYPPQQYAPPRRRRLGRTIFVLAAGIIGGIIAVVAATSNGAHTVSTTGTTTTTAGGGGSAPKTAVVGSAITLAGNDSGEQMAVTVTKVIATASENDGLSLTPSGDRLYAVQYRLRDTGSAAYSDSPSNGAAVVDSTGQSYQSGEETVTGCTSYPATENIAPGASGLGCIVFEIPKNAKITQVQFTLDSGMGPQTGQWNVKS